MTVRILHGDCRQVLATLRAGSVHCCVTSPPYFGLRDYGIAEQIGLEPTPDAFVAELVAVFREVRRVLRDDGTLWLNLGDSYAATTKGSSGVGKNATNKGTLIADRSWQVPPGLKAKDLIGIPWRVAFALQADGWYLRQDIIWSKPNPMPESVTDRCTKAHEYVFLLSKSARYYFDAEAIAEPSLTPLSNGYEASGTKDATARATEQMRTRVAGSCGAAATRNKRSVWTIATQPFSDAHFATMPPELAETCIAAGCPPGGVVLDPFGGAGTTGLVADRLQRDALLIELNQAYASMANKRITGDAPLFADVV
jgi:DNA modification methylase